MFNLFLECMSASMLRIRIGGVWIKYPDQVVPETPFRSPFEDKDEGIFAYEKCPFCQQQEAIFRDLVFISESMN